MSDIDDEELLEFVDATPAAAASAVEEPATAETAAADTLLPSSNVHRLEAGELCVESVTVYNDRAEVTRICAFSALPESFVSSDGKDLKSVVHEVVVTGLPSCVQGASLRVAAKRGRVKILEVAYAQRFAEEEEDEEDAEQEAKKEGGEEEQDDLSDCETEMPAAAAVTPPTEGDPLAAILNNQENTEAIKPAAPAKKKLSSRALATKRRLTRELREVQQQFNTQQEILSRLQAERSFLNSYATRLTSAPKTDGVNVAGIADILQPQTLAGLDQFLDLYAERLAALDHKRTLASEQKTALQKRITSLQQNIAELGGPTTNASHEVTVKLELTSPQEVEFGLVYVVESCRWTPCYDVRGSTQDHMLQLIYYGSIVQNTGEDWTNAQLRLSTAKPSLGGALPKLTPDYLQLGYHQQPSGKSKYHPATGLPSDRDGGAITATFTIPRAVNIASDNKPHKVAITLIELEPELAYKTVPVLSEHAFLRATALNNTVDEIPLLAGECNIFFNNNFVSTSTLPNVNPGESFSVYLGVDPEVRVSYKKLSKYGSKSGLINKTMSRRYDYRSVIKNTKRTPITIDIVDRCPQSTHGSVKIKYHQPTQRNDGTWTDGSKLNDELNLVWTRELAPGEKVAVDVSYTIEWPAGANVTGIDV